ncbi:DUF6527 family protein [Sulfurimonas diazotrophicus]|uniref:DUF6527 family protein n=1 Tax=Sulfurimonas diazotrophicus TaxID=3131939 RepID=A0ABZ3HFB6_9BACT
MLHKFVKNIPDVLEDGVLYISMEYKTIIHLCPCGCGREAITPLSPAQWNMRFDGQNVTIKPSIGSWSFPCRSHYSITNSKVVWADEFSDEMINDVKKKDLSSLKQMHQNNSSSNENIRQGTSDSYCNKSKVFKLFRYLFKLFGIQR